MRVLGFETSCDDTGVAVYDSDAGLLTQKIHQQITTHKPYGGVVPELASRDHSRYIIHLLRQTLAQCSLCLSDIDAIAYTAGPGLIGALLVGTAFARSLAWGANIPSIGVHHLEAHLLAPMLEEDKPDYPFLVLLVSGGHSQFLAVKEPGHYELLGETLDDAAGEAFDKVAKMLGLPYPGGPEIARLAELGDSTRWVFPRPMTNRPGLDLSFSGLKTFALRTFEASPQDDTAKRDIASAFQQAVVDTLCIKAKRALEKTGYKQMVIAGGVAANQCLRRKLAETALMHSAKLYYPRHEFCTDNAAMVAYAGWRRLMLGESDELTINVRARWPITDLTKTITG